MYRKDLSECTVTIGPDVLKSGQLSSVIVIWKQFYSKDAFTKRAETFKNNYKCRMKWGGLNSTCAKSAPANSDENDTMHQINVWQKFTPHAPSGEFSVKFTEEGLEVSLIQVS